MMQLSDGVFSAYENAIPDWFAKLRSKEPDWYLARRKKSVHRVAHDNFPIAAREAWKYSADTRFFDGRILDRLSAADALSENIFIERERAEKKHADAVTIEFNNGIRYKSASLSDPKTEGVEVFNPDALGQEQFALWMDLFARHDRDGIYIDLNEAFNSEVSCIRITRSLAKPLHLVYRVGSEAAVYPRVLIDVLPGVKAEVIEEYCSSNGASSLHYHSNAVCKVRLQEKAELNWVSVIDQGDESFHIGHSHFRVEKSATLKAHLFSLRGSAVRHDFRCDLVDKEAHVDIMGLLLAADKEHSDQRIVLNHNKAFTSSRSKAKALLSDAAQGVFNGRIFIDKHAGGVSAQLHNSNLLLSERAAMNTKPELEIYADDVQCSHGATVGRLDEEQLLYLRSRGLARQQAVTLLLSGFIEEQMAYLAESEAMSHSFYPWLRQKIEEKFSVMLKGGVL